MSGAASSSSRSTLIINFLQGHPNALDLRRVVEMMSLDGGALVRQGDDNKEYNSKAVDKWFSYQSSRGPRSFRRNLARFLNSNLARQQRQATPLNGHNGQWHVDADHLLVTSGASYSFSMICEMLSKESNQNQNSECQEKWTFVCERPTYFLASAIFESAGMTRVEIDVDDEGLNTDHLERGLRDGSIAVPRLVYTIPVHHNPAGVTLSDRRRRHLVALARQYGFCIVADEVYQLLDWTDDEAKPTLPLPLCSYDSPDEPTVFSIGSFAKTLAPGLRLGYVHAAAKLIDRLALSGDAVLHSGGGLYNSMTVRLLERALDDGRFGEHVDALCARYKHLSGLMIASLDEHVEHLALGDVLKYSRPSGGYFVWLRLDASQVNVAATLEAFASDNLVVLPGARCGTALEHCFRLCFVRLEDDLIRQGVARLCHLIHSNRI
jgi:2-aminoadipate transaminase